MTAPTQETLRRGWCPSTLRPMETGDGWLVRLHPPGGRMRPAQLRRIAELADATGNGLVEVSGRGNLQIRGVRPEAHPALVEALLAERLVDEAGGLGPQRLVLSSPLAGQDVGDLIDAASLAASLEHQGRAVSGLPPKTSVIVDGGGALALDGFAADLRLVAIDQGAVVIGLPQGDWLGPVAPDKGGAMAANLLSGLATYRRAEPDTIHRLRDLDDDQVAALIGVCSVSRTQAPAVRPSPRRVGLFALRTSRFALVAGLPFGRSDTRTLSRLSEAASTHGVSEIRFSPWRGLAFLGLEPEDAASLTAQCEELGLITRDDDPRLSVQACSGKQACLRGETRTMDDAAVLAEAAASLLAAGLSLHLSGCVKSCAHAGSADLTLVGHDGCYDVVIGGTTRDKPMARLDLSQIVQRLQPGQDIHTRLTAGRLSGPQV
ncbi:putative precorrin-3B synthase CobG [Bosea sp. LC85]|uniref:precorrin-3B synthase n=1 Tax=Bosea sp. LC85 TaxID=1502851 RepID=UPI0004E3F835|nr:precorrin-3B synthase [Bosea sp. LC85]KFC62148.1 putative precorrin-3B synthase CobG [Bosea sp. LC85]